MSDSKNQAVVFNFFTELGIIDQLVQSALERALPDGLRMAHFGVLTHFISQGGQQSPTHLANAFQVTKGAMTNTLNRLSTRDLVNIISDPEDGRAKLVSITKEGKAMHARAVGSITPMMYEMLAPVEVEEFATALPFLTRLREVLDAARD